MANKTVGELTVANPLDGSELFHTVQGGNSRQVTAAKLLPGKGSSIASAATVTLPYGNFFHITGTTTITDIDFAGNRDGIGAWVEFDGALTLTHNATTLNLPGQASIQTAPGDRAYVVQDNSDNVHVLVYVPAAAPIAHGPHVILEDQKASGTAGGTFSSGVDQTRVLNTEVFDPYGLCSLGSNQFTLPAGTWHIRWSTPTFRSGSAKSWVYNVTDGIVGGYSQTSYNDAASSAQTSNDGSCVVTISAAKVFEIRHRGTASRSTDGLGVAAALTGVEVYSRVEITKLA